MRMAIGQREALKVGKRRETEGGRRVKEGMRGKEKREREIGEK